MQFIIRDATLDDATTIADYNSRMAEETEGRALRPDVIGPGVSRVLRNSARGRYWVAESGNVIVGQLMVTYEWSDWRNATIWWIQSVYVPPECRRKGVFSALYQHVESMAKAEPGVCGLRLYAENDNHRAQETYKALGMVKTSYLVMESMLGKDN